MTVEKKNLVMMSLVAALLLVAVLAIQGCKKSEPAAPPETAEKAASVAIVQTTCPVMGMPINKEIFTEYQGKKVYFCCPECKPKFEKDPQKYIAKLPQFQK